MFLSAFVKLGGLRCVGLQKNVQRCGLLYQSRAVSFLNHYKDKVPAHFDKDVAKLRKEIGCGDAENVANVLATWDAANEKFYSSDRDNENFPHPCQPKVGGNVHFGFLPDEWFQFLYPKTGVMGPYIFTVGLTATLLSKEIWVIDHGFSDVLSFWGAFYILVKFVGPPVKKHLNGVMERDYNWLYTRPMRQVVRKFEKQIKNCDTEVYRVACQDYVNEAKKENVGLQLEAIYRKRMAQVHEQVKNRLDYLLEKQNTSRKMEHEHMVTWIVEGVRKGITPQQENDTLKKCIQDLNSLAKSQGVAAA